MWIYFSMANKLLMDIFTLNIGDGFLPRIMQHVEILTMVLRFSIVNGNIRLLFLKEKYFYFTNFTFNWVRWTHIEKLISYGN